MAYEQRDNSGSLFKNDPDKRRSDNSPEYGGKVMIDGRMYFINGWIKDGAKGKFFSLSFKLMDQQPGQSQPQATRDYGAPRRQQQSAPQPQQSQQNGQRQGKYVPQHGVPDDEIPFIYNHL